LKLSAVWDLLLWGTPWRKSFKRQTGNCNVQSRKSASHVKQRVAKKGKTACD